MRLSVKFPNSFCVTNIEDLWEFFYGLNICSLMPRADFFDQLKVDEKENSG